MLENAARNYSNTCSLLREAITDCNTRIRVSDQNAQLRDKYLSQIKQTEENVEICNGTLNQLTPLLNDTKRYITERREESMQNINNALRMAGEVVTDSAEGIYFHLDKDEAWLSTPDGLDVDAAEGGGYRQISSTFIRSVISQSNADTLDTLMLDEIFSLVSAENSAKLSMYLAVMVQDMQIISIEHKPQVYSNVDCLMYHYNKVNDYTEITSETIKRGAIERTS